jgi:hypothetical protein
VLRGKNRKNILVSFELPRQWSGTSQLVGVLKVLSSEMDPAKIRLIRKVVIKERGPEGFQKNLPVLPVI